MDRRSIMQEGQSVDCEWTDFPRLIRGMEGATFSLESREGWRIVGLRLRAAREALGLKPSELADSCEIDRSHYTKCEKGLRLIRPWQAGAISARHGIDLEFIYAGRLDRIDKPELRAAIYDRLKNLR